MYERSCVDIGIQFSEREVDQTHERVGTRALLCTTHELSAQLRFSNWLEGLRKRILENTKVITDKRSAARTPNFLTRLCVFPCLNTVTRTLLYGLLRRDPITTNRKINRTCRLCGTIILSTRSCLVIDGRIFANSLRNAQGKVG